MANNYTQFSFAIDATPDQREWVLALHALCLTADDWSATEKPEIETRFAGLPLLDDCFDGNIRAIVDVEETDAGLWFHADDCGDVEYTAELLNAFLERHDLDTILSFSSANLRRNAISSGLRGGTTATDPLNSVV
jgi:hypothetical protein